MFIWLFSLLGWGWIACPALAQDEPTEYDLPKSAKPAAKPGTPATPPAQAKPKGLHNPHSAAFAQFLLKQLPQWQEIMTNPAKYRLQIIFTQVNRDKNNRPSLRHHTFQLDTLQYFYPASAIKLPVAIMALEKLNELNIPKLSKYSRLVVGKGQACQLPDPGNPRYPGGYSSIAQYIKTALVVSDNVDFDHLFEFCGQQWLHEKLWAKGYKSVRVLHRLGSYCMPDENRYTNPMTFYEQDSAIYKQPLVRNPHTYRNTGKRLFMGKARIEPDGRKVNGPADFTYRNHVSLKDLHEMMIAVMMPAGISRGKRFNLKADDYKFLHRYLSMYPTELRSPAYEPPEWWPLKMKYLYYGADKDAEPHPELRIFNKVGMAIGFLTDTAYFVDFENKVEFFLSATFYTNTDDVAFGGAYEFEGKALPFFRDLGNVLYNFERERVKKVLPRLNFYQQNYSDGY